MKLPNLILLLTALLLGFMHYAQAQSTPLLSQSASAAYFNNSMSVNMANNALQSNTNTLNINTASVEQLSSLPGIGTKKAEAIIAYRELNGNFVSTEELVNVKGIGPKMLAKLVNKVSI